MILIKVLQIFLFTASSLKFSRAENDCIAIANATEISVRCCKLPDMDAKPNITNLLDEHPELKNMTPEVKHCSTVKIYMEALNQSSLEKEDFKNFIKSSTNDSEWIEIFNKVIDHCVDGLPYYTNVLKTLHKVSDDQCDMRYQAFVTCFNLVARKDCPTKSQENIEKCKNTKLFLDNCLDNEEALKFALVKHHL